MNTFEAQVSRTTALCICQRQEDAVEKKKENKHDLLRLKKATDKVSVSLALLTFLRNKKMLQCSSSTTATRRYLLLSVVCSEVVDESF